MHYSNRKCRSLSRHRAHIAFLIAHERRKHTGWWMIPKVHHFQRIHLLARAVTFVWLAYDTITLTLGSNHVLFIST